RLARSGVFAGAMPRIGDENVRYMTGTCYDHPIASILLIIWHFVDQHGQIETGSMSWTACAGISGWHWGNEKSATADAGSFLFRTGVILESETPKCIKP